MKKLIILKKGSYIEADVWVQVNNILRIATMWKNVESLEEHTYEIDQTIYKLLLGDDYDTLPVDFQDIFLRLLHLASKQATPPLPAQQEMLDMS